MPIELYSLLLIGAIELSWPELDCPPRAQVLEFLDALLTEDLSATIRTATAPPDRLELTIESEGRSVRRAVVLIGECDRRAATVAAVIERVLTAGTVETATVAPPRPLQEPEPKPIARASRSGWLGLGAHAAIGIGGELNGGFDLEGAWWAFDPFGLGLRASYRLPVIEPVGEGDVRIDELRADLFLVWDVWDGLMIEARLFGQTLFARSRRILQPDSDVLFNGGGGLGVRYVYPLGPVAIDLAVRTLIPFRSQRFLVDGAVVAEIPRFQIEGALGVSYAF